MKRNLATILISVVFVVTFSACVNRISKQESMGASDMVSPDTISSEDSFSYLAGTEASNAQTDEFSSAESAERASEGVPSSSKPTETPSASEVVESSAVEKFMPKTSLSVVIKKESLVGAQEIIITSEAEIEKILAFVDGMKKSDFEGPPPTGGEIMSVFVTRNGVDEEYSFMEDQVDGYGLAKNHQDTNVRSTWCYASADAYTYLSSFFK